MRRSAGGGFHCIGAAGDFALELLQVGDTGQSIHASVGPDDCGDMIGTVVFDVEQVGMRRQDGECARIAPDPPAGREDGGLNAVLDQKVCKIRVEAAPAGIQRQRHDFVRDARR